MTKDPEVLDNTLINAKVEFSLTKDDLTDMVLDEREELLENRLDTIKKTIGDVSKKLANLSEKQKDAILKFGKQKLTKKIKFAEKFTGVKAKYEITYFVNQFATETVEFKYDIFEKNYKNRRRKTEKTEWIHGHRLYNKMHVYCAILNKEPFNECSKWESSVEVSLKEVMAMPIIKEIIKADNEHKKLVKEYKLLEAELTNLDTAGKRARSKMVRALLNASEQGRQLLSKMPKINHNLLKA